MINSYFWTLENIYGLPIKKIKNILNAMNGNTRFVLLKNV